MQTNAPFFDDVSKLMTGALGLAQSASEEARAAMRAQADRLTAELDLVRRDEMEAALDVLRAEIVRRSILDHGSLLVGVDWRIDRILASQHGREVDTPVGVITLTYQRGAEKERITLHCEPGMLQRLRSVCDEMLG